MEKNKYELGIRQQADDAETLELYLYGTIEKDWTDFWTGEVHTGNSADYIKEQLQAHPDAKEIVVYINSVGGEVIEGTAIANQLRRNPAHVTVVIDGFACSVASVIACAGDTVRMPGNAVMMIHNMWMTVSGNADELRKAADTLDTLMMANRTIYLDKAGDKLTEEKLTELMDAETWLTAEQCLEYGLCDEVTADTVETIKKADDDANALEQAVARRAGYIKQLQELSAQSLQLVGFDEEADQEPEPVMKPQNYLSTFFE